MPRASVGPITLEYETSGDPGHPALLLVGGLGQQLIAWQPGFCAALVERGLFVIRYDNRDVGLSTHLDHLGKISFKRLLPAIRAERTPEVPYSLDDMAADGIGLLDHLGIDAAHVAGMSMGGMIAQLMALNHRSRVLSLISIMSTSGRRTVGRGTPEATQLLYTPPPPNRDGAIATAVAASRVLTSPGHFDEEESVQRAAKTYDRSFNPAGIGRQLAAILTAPDRTDRLRELSVPTLVIHGTADPLIDHSGGRAVAETVPGATIASIEGMGHDMPEAFWPEIVAAIHAHVSAVENG